MLAFRNHRQLASDPYAPICLYDLIGLTLRVVPRLFYDVPLLELLQLSLSFNVFLGITLFFYYYEHNHLLL